jgi:hypothetical protein
MGRSMAILLTKPGPVCVEGGVDHWLAGVWVVVIWGVELHQRRHSRLGVLLQFECLRRTRGAKAVRHCGGRRKAWMGWLSYVRCSREGQEEKRRCFAAAHRPCQVRKKKTIVAHVARWQVVIARPPVLSPDTPATIAGRFAISINVICVRIRSGLPKRQYRVVIGYVGGPLRHRGKAGCWLFRGS